MQRTRPTAAMVIAVLNVVLGCLGIVAFLIQIPHVQRLLNGGGPARSDHVAAFIAERAPSAWMVQNVYLWVGLVSSIVMIGLGVALLTLRPWARLASIIYALLELARRGADLVYALVVIYPLLHAFSLQEMALARSMEAKRYATGIETTFYIRVVVASLFLLYPLAMLFVMLEPETARAFRTQPVEEIEEEQDWEVVD